MITIMPARTPTLAVSREQAVRLFTECRVVAAEVVEDFAAWTFPGGVVLILDHTADPACFRICLDTRE